MNLIYALLASMSLNFVAVAAITVWSIINIRKKRGVVRSRKTDNVEFSRWIKAVNVRGERNGYPGRSIVADTGIDYWRPYYEKGLGPMEAVEFDMSLWD